MSTFILIHLLDADALAVLTTEIYNWTAFTKNSPPHIHITVCDTQPNWSDSNCFSFALFVWGIISPGPDRDLGRLLLVFFLLLWSRVSATAFTHNAHSGWHTHCVCMWSVWYYFVLFGSIPFGSVQFYSCVCVYRFKPKYELNEREMSILDKNVVESSYNDSGYKFDGKWRYNTHTYKLVSLSPSFYLFAFVVDFYVAVWMSFCIECAAKQVTVHYYNVFRYTLLLLLLFGSNLLFVDVLFCDVFWFVQCLTTLMYTGGCYCCRDGNRLESI